VDEATASVYIAAIAAIASTISIVVSARANKQAKETHTAVNSRMDEMLALTKTASHAEGMADERAEVAGRAVPGPVPVTIVADEPVPVREMGKDER
jgi:hypothetical protein